MSAEGLIDFEELRTPQSAREAAERELLASRGRTAHLAQPERDRDGLLKRYAALVLEAISPLEPKERREAHKMIELQARLGSDGSLELGGDVVRLSNLEISPA